MSIQHYAVEAGYTIAQVTSSQSRPLVFIPVTLDTIVSLIFAAIIFLGISVGAWWRILSRLGYRGKVRLLWLIGMAIFPISAIAVIVFAFLPWPKLQSNKQRQESV